MDSCDEVSKAQTEKHQKSKVLVKSLYEQKTDGTFCDVELYVQGSVILCHACILVSCSSYFMKYLQNSSHNVEQSSHWCWRQPLIIDLDSAVNDTENFCVNCVSEIINFMYLKEIILLDGHYDHFKKIIQFLEISDLTHLCLEYFTENQSSIVDNCTSEKPSDENGYVSNPINKSTPSPVHSSATLEKKSNFECQKALQNISYDLCLQNDEKQALSKVVENKDVQIPDFSKSIAHKHKNKLDLIDREKSESFLCSGRLNLASEQGRVISKKDASICDFSCCNKNKDNLFLEAEPHKNRKLMCRLCSESSFSARKMLKHLENKDHFGTECPICFWKSENINDLKEHLKDHDHPKPYKCHVCSKRHRLWAYHKLHLKVHCRNKKFFCEFCQKGFERHYNLNVHLMTHKKKYLCKKCNFSACNIKTFKSHILQHSNENLNNIIKASKSDSDNQITLDIDLKKYEEPKEFHCHICKEGFTQNKNLKRHINLKHCNTEEYKCLACDYQSKRTDLLRHHMKKHHQGLSIEFKEKKLKNKSCKKQKQNSHSNSDIIGVLIPVQLVSTNNSSAVNAFAVKTCVRESGESNVLNEDNTKGHKNEIVKIDLNKGSNHLDQTCHPGTNLLNNPNMFTESSDNKLNLLVSESSSLMSLPSNDRKNTKFSINEQELSVFDLKSLEKSKCAEINCFNNSSELLDLINNIHSDSKECNDIRLTINKASSGCNENTQDKAEVLNGKEDIWLNEATGELLSGSNFLNVLIDPGSNLDPGHQMTTPVKGNTSLELRDHLQTFLNDATEDKDDAQSNPNTPQTNLVDLDDLDNVFPWNHLDANFCSTWVLNEATGELNMVSFDVQPLRNSDQLKFNESTGFSSIDDDETALFLNEGTGDLSVIYFNPKRNESIDLEHILDEHFTQENIETLSEHSNDDDDTLNEEFLTASVNFMAHNGNETFLNELTGEFDIANYNNYHPGTQDSQVSGFESIHLNEETGEISWNVLDQNFKTEFFENAEHVSQEVEDSVNCDEFEPFSTEMSDFSSLFQLDTNTGDWQIVEETCDTLLNECTGEIIKKSE